ncbi:hypothetical protein H257_16826 [Aphanomyces astaci]|uniref:WRKY19-like zinc finger domain-containing protein n=1 Tax=Aphanomyces astaci TaxID=112090 RepID=W4FIR7_APHAT|nr:hypothetical protein H257_16826 [Aphanomyces astaci]ETV66726.1 hypothetical protein H257_16826 [Aphanomyces astaci]|eukprot:XP_009843702.1 hypothetical protein H257_16826 [Aphanomyces astaci]
MHRTSMDFLLNPVACDANEVAEPHFQTASQQLLARPLHASSPPLLLGPHPQSWKLETAVQELISVEFRHTCLTQPTAASQPQRHQCKILGCTTASVSKGLCVRHGGGTRCAEPGCTKRTKRFQRCYMHGGFLMCSEHGCASKAKRFGRCWAHGGGITCTEAGCDKLSVKGGLCWTHGGGCRCDVQQCGRRAYKRFGFRCQQHATNTAAVRSVT